MESFPAAEPRGPALGSFLTITGKMSVRIGTLLYVYGSCDRHSELTEEADTKGRLSSSLTFLYTGQKEKPKPKQNKAKTKTNKQKKKPKQKNKQTNKQTKTKPQQKLADHGT